ncbi:histidinol dehydrogenase [Oleiagrimonas soli]|uniref:Histidinol dehydrogenase n=1 Tax=Oleiagrimonas soli TaxID=1543381 RepID=A0A099CW42_9GAMM|nr:histidinol dehydrogenase [Oleiagrimonas soli]KGI77954.1 histidinol dehydrogenase [Oleiagrimonas soli]MBB6183671.1 histidinol dehydrogenase [Oleiagrimonas soli]
MNIVDWNALDAETRNALLQRPAQAQNAERAQAVARIIAQVAQEGDAALKRWTAQLDGCELDALAVPGEAFDVAEASLDVALKKAIADARARIEAFHRAAAPQPVRVETAPGVVCERVLRPVTRVGLYVPAGTAPLPSTALMLGVPAQLAGCREVVLCTPPRADGSVDLAVLYAARLCGIERVFRLGGAQAIAAMALGTESVPRCDKLFGPGNGWVTEAKQQVSAVPGGPAIDMPAGPSEVLVIADADADPCFVAADLLSQAEHGPDSQVLLLTDAREQADAVVAEVERQVARLPRADTARKALSASRVIRVASLAQAVEVSNAYAPEHLILNVADPRALLAQIDSAGSIFLGAWSPESVGDYCSGTNHVLPTYGHARAWSGVSVASFQKQITVQELSGDGLRGIGACAVTLAEAEGLEAHAQAVRLRLAALEATA